MDQKRYERGLARLREIAGEDRAEQLLAGVGAGSPAVAEFVVEWVFGDVYTRPQLVDRDRQLVVLSVLTTLGGCEPQLRFHIGASLHSGLTPDEILEVMVQAIGYAGFPRVLNALTVASEVFASTGVSPQSASPT